MSMTFFHFSFVVSCVKIQDVVLATRACVGDCGLSISIKFLLITVVSCGFSKAFVILCSTTKDATFSKHCITCGWDY